MAVTRALRFGLVAIGITLVPTSAALASPDDGICVGPESTFDAGAEAELRTLANNFRTENGVRPLRASARLSGVARRHSLKMAQTHVFGHSGSSGGFPWSRSRPAGENLALAGTPEAAMELLKGSPTHRHTLLSRSYRNVGMGAFRTCTGHLLVTQNFTG